MSGRAFDHATEAFAFIESLEGLRAPEAVVDAMERSFALFGFHTFIVTGLPHPRERFDQVVLLRRWPAGWFELYAGEDYVRVDPVIRMCRNTVQPFEWSEAPYHPQREPPR